MRRRLLAETPQSSGFHAHAVVGACRKMKVRFSTKIRMSPEFHGRIAAIPEAAWTPVAVRFGRMEWHHYGGKIMLEVD